jgi:hypothetical protein
LRKAVKVKRNGRELRPEEGEIEKQWEKLKRTVRSSDW